MCGEASSNGGPVGCPSHIPGEGKRRLVPAKTRLMNGRAKPGQAYEPTDIEHLANMVTHGLFIVPSIIGCMWMLHLACSTPQHVTAAVYGMSLIFLFSVSTTFHTLCYSGNHRTLKDIFHVGDRAAIYIFIASSYTPWLTLKTLNLSGLNQFMLWLVWIMAVLGILYQYTFHEQYKWLETFFYFVIGVCPAAVVFTMVENSGVSEAATGGLVYIIGVVFFKCDGRIPFAHAIWHCFVFVGALFHYIAVCKHLLGIRCY